MEQSFQKQRILSQGQMDFNLITGVKVNILWELMSHSAEDFRIKYYRYPLSQDKYPVAMYNTTIKYPKGDGTQYTFKKLNRHSMVGLFNKGPHKDGKVQFYICALRKMITRFRFKHDSRYTLRLEDICELKPGILYMSMTQYDESQYDYIYLQYLVTIDTKKRQKINPGIDHLHQIQFTHFFRDIPHLEYPRYYFDPHVLTTVHMLHDQLEVWKLNVPAYDNVEIWSFYMKELGILSIQEKRFLYPFEMIITQFMLSVHEDFDQELLCSVVELMER